MVQRVTALRLSPDGTWLAAAVQSAAGDPASYVTSIWRIDPEPAGRPPVRLTRSAEGEGAPEFLPDGAVLFVSGRPDPVAAKQKSDAAQDKPGLWLLPAAGGEARRIAAPAGSVAGVSAARQSGVFAYAVPHLPAAASADEDARLRRARTDAGVSAILHESGRVRYWDHDLGPDEIRLLAAELEPGSAPDPADADQAATSARDLTPAPGRALDEQHFELTPDGSAVVTGWSVPEPDAGWRDEVAVIDVVTGARRVLLTAEGADFSSPRISPDGRLVAALRYEHDSYQRPGDATLVVVPLSGGGREGGDDGGDAHTGEGAGTGTRAGAARDLLPGFDRQPTGMAWAPDSGSVFFTADDQGRRPVFRVGVTGGDPVRVTTDDGAYDNLCVSPDGSRLYALRSAIDEPPAPVRIDVASPASGPIRLAAPGTPLEVPGRLEDVRATAADGTVIRGWLVLPESASAGSPAPLLLWVHGGPVSSWNEWSWRWNPWLMAARGYAVLLPDPALSTGYGQHMIARGHGQWGGNPYTDVLAITDEVAARPDIDASRTAMMGGSFGGYMANWIAGHTDRFLAIVSHAGLWALDQMFGTTDGPPFWRRIFGDPATQPERYQSSSPNLHADSIRTPVLIIHGDKDYRVPVGEALRMYWDLTARSREVKFLYFPDENHWILKPGDAQVWYETVLAFLAEHVLGEKWQRPGWL